MKPFDIELAKKKHPVQTRDGRPVRILCFDRKDKDCPVVALVPWKEDVIKEELHSFTAEGKLCRCDSDIDLFMATIKKEGWINLYKEDGHIEVGAVYDSKKEAEGYVSPGDKDYITTIKIEWEE